MTVAADLEAAVAARPDSLRVIAEAHKMLADTSSGAVLQSYFFIRVSTAAGFRSRSHADLANSEVITVVRELSRKYHSSSLAQLVTRIAAVAKPWPPASPRTKPT